MKMEQTECSETSAYKIQMPGNYPKESIQHSEHDESLKSRSKSIPAVYCSCCMCVSRLNAVNQCKLLFSNLMSQHQQM